MAHAQREYASPSRVQAERAAHVAGWVSELNARAAIGDVPARPVLVLSEMVLTEKTTTAVGKMTLGLAAVKISAAPFNATSRERAISTNFPLRDDVAPRDVGVATLAEVVRDVDARSPAPRGFEFVGRPDAKLGTIMKSKRPKGWKHVPGAASAAGHKAAVRERLGVSEAELVMGFDVGGTRADGVTDKQRFEMLGNSIPVHMLQHILRPLVVDGWLPRIPTTATHGGGGGE